MKIKYVKGKYFDDDKLFLIETNNEEAFNLRALLFITNQIAINEYNRYKELLENGYPFFLKEAMEEVIKLEEWEFEPKTILTWEKQVLGVGRWLRNITEHCILAIKGKPVWDNKRWTTLISEKRTTHSTKPEIFYKMVEDICYGRKLDYFGRKKRKGWEVYGDEVK